jgi:hypothetical protein
MTNIFHKNSKSDPLVDAVKSVMERNDIERAVTEFLNEELGIFDRKALPHDLQVEYDALYEEAMGDEELLAELSKKTLKSYQKKATTSRDRAEAKSDKEEDKAMSTDGEKYPEKQDRHINNAKAAQAKAWKREAGLKMVSKKLAKEEAELEEATKHRDWKDRYEKASGKKSPAGTSKTAMQIKAIEAERAKKPEKVDEAESPWKKYKADKKAAKAAEAAKETETEKKPEKVDESLSLKKTADKTEVVDKSGKVVKTFDYKNHSSGHAKKASEFVKYMKKYTKEEAEQIDELSKDTLKSYTKKASVSLQNLGKKASVEGAKANMAKRLKDTADEKRHGAAHKKAASKWSKRWNSVDKAEKKLAEASMHDVLNKINQRKSGVSSGEVYSGTSTGPSASERTRAAYKQGQAKAASATANKQAQTAQSPAVKNAAITAASQNAERTKRPGSVQTPDIKYAGAGAGPKTSAPAASAPAAKAAASTAPAAKVKPTARPAQGAKKPAGGGGVSASTMAGVKRDAARGTYQKDANLNKIAAMRQKAVNTAQSKRASKPSLFGKK